MAYTAGNLHLRAGAPGNLTYTYDAASDSLDTVATAGYFNNSDDNLALVVGDQIFAQAGDGNAWFLVASLSSGSVTLQFAGGDLPTRYILGTASAALTMGYTEIGTGTATKYSTPIPYAGAHLIVSKQGTVAGSPNITTSSAGVTVNGRGDRIITPAVFGDTIELVGVSATQWRVVSGAQAVYS